MDVMSGRLRCAGLIDLFYLKNPLVDSIKEISKIFLDCGRFDRRRLQKWRRLSDVDVDDCQFKSSQTKFYKFENNLHWNADVVENDVGAVVDGCVNAESYI